MATAAGLESEALLTAEEFARRPDSGFVEELVRGRVVRMNSPKPYHGYVCLNVGRILGNFVEQHDLGYTLGNDSGVLTARAPDTLRGADVAFYPYTKVPKGSLSRDHYLDVPPDLVVEVLSPDDRWPRVLEKVAEYLNADVLVVAVLDTERRELHVYTSDGPRHTLVEDDEWTLPAILPGFGAVVRRFFE